MSLFRIFFFYLFFSFLSLLFHISNSTSQNILAPKWEEYVNNKIYNANYTNYPIRVVTDPYDIKGNCTLISEIMETRLNDKTKPEILVIVAEGILE